MGYILAKFENNAVKCGRSILNENLTQNPVQEFSTNKVTCAKNGNKDHFHARKCKETIADK